MNTQFQNKMSNLDKMWHQISRFIKYLHLIHVYVDYM